MTAIFRGMTIVLLMTLVLPDVGMTQATSPDATVWVSHLRACLKRVFSIRAEFVMERKDKQSATDEAWQGTLELRRGGRYRLTYHSPKRRLVVSDGVTAWAYDQAARIAYSSPADDLLVDHLLELISGEQYKKHFKIDFLGGSTRPRGGGFGAIQLIPFKKHPFIASLTFTLDNKCPCIRRVLIAHHDGTVTRITLSDVHFNVGIGKRRFEFTPPKGTHVITP